jgi:hypothetical protein
MSFPLAWLWIGLQTQAEHPASAQPAAIPEVLNALADLVKASGGVPKVDGWWSPERIQAVASAVGSIAWPLTVLAVVLILRKPIVAFLSNVTDVEIAGAKFKRLQQVLDKAGAEASKRNALFQPPTEADLARAESVKELLDGLPSLVRQEAEALAYEYERVRASMLPGDERTRRMEVVVAKMRTIGRAVYPLRHELAASSSPGKRLQAIAALQVVPDYDMLNWLAERIKAERPFISYHALLALIEAARNPAAAGHRAALIEALSIAEFAKGSFGEDTDRYKLLRSFGESVVQVQTGADNVGPSLGK